MQNGGMAGITIHGSAKEVDRVEESKSALSIPSLRPL